MSLRRALVGFVAAGCLFLLVEVFIEHSEVLKEKPVAWAPIIVLSLSLLASLWAFAQWQSLPQRAFQIASLLLLLVGVAGLYFHNAERFESHERAERAEREHPGEVESHEEEHHAPPLAPLAISGMGVLGLMATYPKWQREE